MGVSQNGDESTVYASLAFDDRVRVAPKPWLLAAEPTPVAIASKVDDLFGEWAKPDSPGCAVAVVRGGRVVYAKGYGMADLEHGVAITPRTVFYIGSVGKQFTAYAVVKLAQQGKLARRRDPQASPRVPRFRAADYHPALDSPHQRAARLLRAA